jgi:hypothetical protein
MATSVSVAVWLEKIGLPSLSPIFEIKILASYSKTQEAYLYAKFKGEISGIEINFFNHKQNIACSFKSYKQNSVLFDI